ncbi:MAG: helix-turn-helix domain-containing protein [Chlamydiia bacterium]|nr:helix-turn-helix domain-containing protein [Chlamydiia bacterium]
MVHPDCQKIGDELKKRRTELNVSLKEVENATSIRMSYLDSLEKGEWKQLISPVYTQGFLKQYAIYLGMDAEKLVREHIHLFQRSDNQHFDYGIGTLEMRGSPGANIKWLPNAIWIGAFGLIALVGWLVGRFLEVF